MPVSSSKLTQPGSRICDSDPDIASKIEVPYFDGRAAPCSDYVDRIEAIADRWNPHGHPIDYCLSEVVDQHCSFNGNLPIIYVVIVANAIKVLVMLIVAYHLVGNPLITIGDAVESFLDVPDDTTKDACYLTRLQAVDYVRLRKEKESRSTGWKEDSRIDGKPRIKTLKVFRWSQAASKRRWILTIGLLVIAVATVVGLLAAAIDTLNAHGTTTIGDLGFGKMHVEAVIGGWAIEQIANPSTQILAAILIANLPQAILSFLYLNLNGLLTVMFTAFEWSKFATERKPLRVSTPKGQQQSTHFLQLPYKVAIPLMFISATLHWLVSQSIFLTVVAAYNSDGGLDNPVQIASCCFSPMAMIIVIVFGVLMIVGCFAVGLFRYDPHMPLVGSCSVAISAACHRPDWDVDAAVLPVQWGVIPGSDETTGVGHCSFTSGPVESVQEGKEYAGVKRG